MISTIKKLPEGEVEIEITVPADIFMNFWKKGLSKVQEVVEIDGFRKGHVPENIIMQKFGEMSILEEMANLALREAYILAINEHKLVPVSDPKVTIKKIAKNSPLELSLVIAVLPVFDLPDYKKIDKSGDKEEEINENVTDEEVVKVLRELKKGRTHGHKHGSHGHEHEKADDQISQEETTPLSEEKEEESEGLLDDTFAQSFGEKFKTIEDLKEKIRENLSLEKKQKNVEKKRSSIMEKIIAGTAVEIPKVLLEDELTRMVSQMKGDITRFGGTWEEYLSHMKKTEEKIKEEWNDDAKKRVSSQLILAKIAEIEKLKATEEEVEVEMIRLLAKVKDADPENAKQYLYQAITNEKVLKFLEGENK